MSVFKSWFKRYTLTTKLATRYYSTGVESTYVRFINRASRIGFAIGVAALIIGLSLMNGFERELKNTLLSAIPHVEYEAVDGHLSDWSKTATQALQHEKVVGAAPYFKLNAMVQKGQQMEAVLLKGVDAILEPEVSIVPKSIREGDWLSTPSSDINAEVVIGSGLSEKLSIGVGDKLELLIPSYSETGKLKAPSYLVYQVVGVYHVGGQVDQGQVFTSIRPLVEKQGLSITQAQGVAVSFEDPFAARTLGSEVGQLLNDYVYVLDWFRTHGHVYNDIVLVRDIMYLVMVLVMAVASFNIVSSLAMSVQEKYGDIGILKTMGLSVAQVRQVFVMMGLLTAVQGIAWGTFFGIVLGLNLSGIMHFAETLFNFKALDGDVYFIDYLPSEVNVGQVVIIVTTALVIAYLASLYPARKASRMNPIELIQ